jgi:serine/threonine-protein kinase RsbW
LTAQALPGVLELTCSALPDEIARLRHAFGAFARTIGLARTLTDDIAIAISEAATNSVVHAYPDGPGDVTLFADASDPRMVRVTIADDGDGMKPRPDTMGLGLGLPLMAELADHLAIAPGEGGRGTRVSMEFTRG